MLMCIVPTVSPRFNSIGVILPSFSQGMWFDVYDCVPQIPLIMRSFLLHFERMVPTHCDGNGDKHADHTHSTEKLAQFSRS